MPQAVILASRYQIIQPLAEGGFGRRFLACDRPLPGSPQGVIKQLSLARPNLDTLKTAQRLFSVEAETLYLLGTHPQIPALLAHFRTRRRILSRTSVCSRCAFTDSCAAAINQFHQNLQDNLFLFLEDAAIPPTHNASEQAIRMSKIFRKVTNGFRSDWGKNLFAAVRSVVNTGKRQGLSALQFIQMAISGQSLFQPG